MRKNYVLSLVTGIGLCCTTGAMAQESGIVRPIDRQVSAAKARQLFREVYSPFKMSTTAARPGAEQVVSEATYLSMQPEQTLRLFKERPAALNLNIPQRSGAPLELELVQHNPLTEDFTVTTSDSKGQPVPYTPGVYYRGIIKGQPGSVVAVSVFHDEIIGVASTEQEGNIVLGRLEEEGNRSRYILYSDKDLKIANTGNCYTETLPEYLEEIKQLSNMAAKPTVDKCVRVYLECDYALRVNKGSVTNTVNYITAVFNNVATLYANESITTYISGTFVWNNADAYSTTSAGTALDQFRNLRQTFNGDLAHLVAYKSGNSFAGIAWVNTLCTPYRYAYSQIQATYSAVPTYSWTVYVITHEMGHNLGSPHTHNCTAWAGGPIDGCAPTYNSAYAEGSCAPGPIPSSTVKGTIMSYCHLLSNVGIKFANGFGPQPGNLIRNRITAASCLSTCSQTNASGTKSGLQTTAIAEASDDRFTIYPNPASDRLYLNWVSKEKGMTRIVLTDLSGRVIEVRTLTSAAGENNFVLRLNLKVPGMYLIRLENGTDVSWRKVMIQ